MSLSHWAVACRGIPKETPDLQKSRPGAGCIGNPRTIGRSGCTPAEPYPPNRKTKISLGSEMRKRRKLQKVLPMCPGESVTYVSEPSSPRERAGVRGNETAA